MGFWKELVDKAAAKKDELSEEAKRRAAKRAGEMALDTGKAAARAAVKSAGKTLDYAGRRLEQAIFGGPLPGEEPARSAATAEAPDPFAKVKADLVARTAAVRQDSIVSREREQARARSAREVDDELAELKRKIRGAR